MRRHARRVARLAQRSAAIRVWCRGGGAAAARWVVKDLHFKARWYPRIAFIYAVVALGIEPF